jgi:hypothetical protein
MEMTPGCERMDKAGDCELGHMSHGRECMEAVKEGNEGP